jgi:hypothetical protein
LTAGDLLQAATVYIDLVQIEPVGPALSPGEDDFLRVVMDSRVADGPFRVVDEQFDFARGQVEFAQASFLAVELAFDVEGVVSEVCVPVSVSPALACCEYDLLNAEFRQGRGVNRFGRRLGESGC